MPRKGHKRKKRRTHVRQVDESEEKSPKSFIFRRGACAPSVVSLVDDLRHMMKPHTADKLKESNKNKLRDFVHVASQLGVSHFMVLTQSDMGVNLRVMRVPRGPTLTFRVVKFSLVKDITAMLRRPASLDVELQHSPLVVLNNFSGEEQHKQLMAAMFQNMFPPLNVQTMRLKECRRVVLFNYNPDTGFVDLRHFLITASPVGLTRRVKKIIKAKLPDLSRFEDISDYVLGAAGGDVSSDSEAEDTEENRVTLTESLQGRGNRASHRSAIRLKEIGPRVTLELLKIVEGLDDGRVLYNQYVTKSKAEEVQLERQKQERDRLKQQRKAEQEANVQRKQDAKKEKKELRKQRYLERQAEAGDSDENADADEEESGAEYSNSDSDGEESEDEQLLADLDRDIAADMAASDDEEAPSTHKRARKSGGSSWSFDYGR